MLGLVGVGEQTLAWPCTATPTVESWGVVKDRSIEPGPLWSQQFHWPLSAPHA